MPLPERIIFYKTLSGPGQDDDLAIGGFFQDIDSDSERSLEADAGTNETLLSIAYTPATKVLNNFDKGGYRYFQFQNRGYSITSVSQRARNRLIVTGALLKI